MTEIIKNTVTVFRALLTPAETSLALHELGTLDKRRYNESKRIVHAWLAELNVLDYLKDDGHIDAGAWCRALWARLPEHDIALGKDDVRMAYTTLKDKRHERKQGHARALGVHAMYTWIQRNEKSLAPEHFAKLEADKIETPEDYDLDLVEGQDEANPDTADGAIQREVRTPEEMEDAMLLTISDMYHGLIEATGEPNKRCFAELKALLIRKELMEA